MTAPVRVYLSPHRALLLLRSGSRWIEVNDLRDLDLRDWAKQALGAMGEYETTDDVVEYLMDALKHDINRQLSKGDP